MSTTTAVGEKVEALTEGFRIMGNALTATAILETDRNGGMSIQSRTITRRYGKAGVALGNLIDQLVQDGVLSEETLMPTELLEGLQGLVTNTEDIRDTDPENNPFVNKEKQ